MIDNNAAAEEPRALGWRDFLGEDIRGYIKAQLPGIFLDVFSLDQTL